MTTDTLAVKCEKFKSFLEKHECVGFTGRQIVMKQNKKGEYKKSNAVYQKHSMISMENYHQFIKEKDGTYCIITGKKSNLVVFDFDTSEAYENFTKAFPQCKNDLTIKTNKGYHIYFEYNDAFSTLATNSVSNVDIRSNEGLVYAYPTEYDHPEKGIIKYEIFKDGKRGTITPEIIEHYNVHLNDKYVKERKQKTVKKKDTKVTKSNTAEVVINKSNKVQWFKELCKCFSEQTVANYSEWTLIGLALKQWFEDEDNDGYECFKYFSYLYSKDADESELENKWKYAFNALRKDTNGEQIIEAQAKKDNKAKFMTLKKFKYQKAEDIDTKFTSNLNVEYMNTLNYNTQKQYFETFCAYVMRPNACIVWNEVSHDGDAKLVYYTTKQIEDIFRNVYLQGETHPNGERKRFIQEWLNDETRLTYNEINFIPFNKDVADDSIPSHIYNLFDGYNKDIYTDISHYSKEQRLKKVKPYLDLQFHLCGANKEVDEYVTHLLACKIQYPRRRIPVALILKGLQGVGKNVWLNANANLINSRHYFSSSKMSAFFGEYAEGYYRKLIINIDESESRKSLDYEGQMKTNISEDKLDLNRKFQVPIQIDNYALSIITSNKPNPFKIDFLSGDRRFIIIIATEEYLKAKYNKTFWDKLVVYFKEPSFVACLYDYYMSFDVDTFDFKQRPITEAYAKAVTASVSVEGLHLAEICDINYVSFGEHHRHFGSRSGRPLQRHLPNEIPLQELFQSYQHFCERLNFKDTKDFRYYISTLDALHLPIRMNGHTSVCFTPHAINQEMKKKKWLLNDSIINVEVEAEDTDDVIDDDYFM